MLLDLGNGDSIEYDIVRKPILEAIRAESDFVRSYIANPTIHKADLETVVGWRDMLELPRLKYNRGYRSYSDAPVIAVARAVLSNSFFVAPQELCIPERKEVTLYVVGRNSTGHHVLGDVVALCGESARVFSPMPIPLTSFVSYKPLSLMNAEIAKRSSPALREETLELLV